MLFDLGTGKKKRVIQVIYGMLALCSWRGLRRLRHRSVRSDRAGSPTSSPTTAANIAETRSAKRRTRSRTGSVKDHRENQEAPRAAITTPTARVAPSFSDRPEETGSPCDAEQAEQEYEQAADAWDRYIAPESEQIEPERGNLCGSDLHRPGAERELRDDRRYEWAAAAGRPGHLVKRRPSGRQLQQPRVLLLRRARLQSAATRRRSRPPRLAANPGAGEGASSSQLASSGSRPRPMRSSVWRRSSREPGWRRGAARRPARTPSATWRAAAGLPGPQPTP